MIFICIKTSIPYSQAIRYRRIIDEDNEFTKHLNNLENKLIKRDFPSKLDKQQIQKVHNLNRK